MHILFLSELFVLFLLVPVVFRVFFKKRNKVDTTVVFSLFAFIISILLVLTNGLSLSVIAAAVPCFFVFFFSLRSLGRCFQQLKMDAYTPGAIIASIFGIIFVAAGAYVIIAFYPVSTFIHLNSSECTPIEIQKENKAGSFASGFEKPELFKKKISVTFYSFSPELTQENETDFEKLPVIIYLPDVYTSINENRLSIESIARKGNIVLCADFYTKDGAYLDSFMNSHIFRSFALQTEFFKAKVKNIPQDNSQLQIWQNIKVKELEAIFDYAKEAQLFDRIKLIAADGNAANAAEEFCTKSNIDIPVFAIDENIPGYIGSMGNLAVNQPAVYHYVAEIQSDGWIQSQQIAARIEKAKVTASAGNPESETQPEQEIEQKL